MLAAPAGRPRPRGAPAWAPIPRAAAIAIGWPIAPDRAGVPPQYELQLRMDKETPRNHLDMRHRITSDGKRYGKVIDYK